jgi:adenylate cyclase
MQRKLTVIFSADVVGYSSLMERDEAGTLARLKENRKALFDPCVAAHGGRVFKLMGDGALIEFPSAASAVTCALEVQRGMETGESHHSESDKLRYRIGINLGDVIIEGDDIYGEGVNVAARIQALAPAGGTAVSHTVRDQVAGKIAAEFEDLGQHSVKNIERPIHVFAVHPKRTSELTGNVAAEKRQRASICVLPFANMSGDLEQEYFSDGISEDIITDLSKVSALAVTARNTAFMFKGKHVDVPQVARQLKVAHILEGSVRKSGNRVRITAQLIDGKSGDHVWAERYDRDLADIFALQDEISEAIVKALKVRLLPEEKKDIERRGTTDTEAYKLYLMARQMWGSGNISSPRIAEAVLSLCVRATEIDPNYAHAWALMSRAQSSLRNQLGKGEAGFAEAERALTLDPRLPEAHCAMSLALRLVGRIEDSLRAAETAVQLDPQLLEANLAMANSLYALGRYAEAIPYFEKAASLTEGAPFAATGMISSCYAAMGDKSGARRAAVRAVEVAEKAVAADPANGAAIGFLVTGLAALGDADRAKAWADRALLLDSQNLNMRYNFACSFALLNDFDTALDLLEPVLAGKSPILFAAKNDPDLESIREHPRFKAMMAAAEARVAQAKSEGKS